MWQVLLAAAVAGSTGFVAKHFLNSNSANQSPVEKIEEQQESIVASAFDSPAVPNDCDETGYESNREGIFRFSSSGSSGKEIRSSRKKLGISGRRLKFRAENEKVERRSGGGGGGGCLEGSDRRFAICLKKRRTAKTNSVPAKCGSSSSKDNSLFGWGLGIGIIYMMSAGKAEITKLSTAMDETSRVVHELRTELYKRKSKQFATSSRNIIGEPTQLVLPGSSTERKDHNDTKINELPLIDDAEICPSSVDIKAQEMNHLVAELESKLQKLPCSTTEAPGCKAEISSKGFHESKRHGVFSYQCDGVLPSELDRRLCHLLINQQENQIGELESELSLSQSKLREKESELQALKDCVRQLTEISLSSVSDDEAELQVGQQCNIEVDKNGSLGSEARKSVVGMKRPIYSA